MKIMATELNAAEREICFALSQQVVPRVIPADWRIVERHPNALICDSTDGLRVILEVEGQIEVPGLREDAVDFWLHLSVSRRDRVPSYFDQKRVKALFIGRQQKAIMVFPPESEHYNHHAHCLHLFSALTRDALPDFRAPGGQL